MNNLFKCHSVHILPCSYFFTLAVISKYVIYTGMVCLLICRLHLHSSYQTFTPPPHLNGKGLTGLWRGLLQDLDHDSFQVTHPLVLCVPCEFLCRSTRRLEQGKSLTH